MSARERELPGRVPLIVPPAAAKSSYYRTPTLSQLWQNARRALSQPGAYVSIVGYSLPLTDLSTAGMLRETLGPSRPGAPVHLEVVNPDASAVVRNLAALGVDSLDVPVLESVREFTQRYVARAASDALGLLGEGRYDLDRFLLAGTSLGAGRKVVGIDVPQNGTLVLVLEGGNPPYTSTNLGLVGAPPPLQVRDLVKAVASTGAAQLEVVASGDRRVPVVALAEHATSMGAGDGRWLVLITVVPLG